MSLEAGSRLGPHEILRGLGAGGMGEVYLARDTRLEREVALKVIPARMSDDPAVIAGFRREALTLASLNHPNIATVHGFEEVPGGPWVLVLEHVEGVTLAQRLKSGPLPMREAMAVCSQIAEALEVAHEHGIIHRDLKPGNVMIGPRGLVKVLDFGLARRVRGVRDPHSGPEAPDASAPPARPVAGSGAARPPVPPEVDEESETIAVPAVAPGEAETVVAPPGATAASGAPTDSMEGMTVGTPGYMSPEQIRAGEFDARTDLFAFGCVLYECLSGRRAFDGDDALQVMRNTLRHEPDPGGLPAAAPARVRSLVDRCLRKDPADRPAGMREARLELEEALGIRRAAALREGGAAVVPNNLPTPATSFVGREHTLAECGELLEQARLVTLAGIGGSGKTRLALRLAEQRMEAFPDGVWFVDAAPLANPGRLVEVLAATLGVHEEPGRDLLQGVTERLTDRCALLLLDSCEAHPAACAGLAAHLVASCRGLRLLMTSREPVGLEGESVYTVPVLGAPPANVTDAAEATRFESVQLFVERARAASPAFELDDANTDAVAEVCRRLDGIPLAIELAAARVRLLPVEQIRARLGDRFKLLTRAPGAGPDRHQTVRAVIQWSWDHLLPPEQELMARLAVFHGGWTLERATAVCSERVDEFEMLDLLTRLVERSLVVVDRDAKGNARYRFLESVWRFTLEQFEARPDAAEVRDRHLAVYSEFAKRAGMDLTGPKLSATLREVGEEEENVLAALAFCDRAPDGALRSQRLVNDVYRFWALLGQYERAQHLIEESLARDPARTPTLERADGLTRAAGLAITRGLAGVARANLEEGLGIIRERGDRRRMARVLSGLAVAALYQERYQDAMAFAEEGLALYEALGERRGVALALHNLATLEAALARPGLGRARFEAALEILRQAGDEVIQVLCLSGLAATLARLGEPGPARQRLREGVSMLRRVGSPREVVYALEALAEVTAADDPATAARLLGATERAREDLRMPPSPIEAVEMRALAGRLEASLGVAGADEARAAGRLMSLDASLAEAGALLGLPPV